MFVCFGANKSSFFTARRNLSLRLARSTMFGLFVCLFFVSWWSLVLVLKWTEDGPCGQNEERVAFERFSSLQTRTRAVSRFFTTGVKFKIGGAPTGEQNKRMEGCRANKVQPNSALPHIPTQSTGTSIKLPLGWASFHLRLAFSHFCLGLGRVVVWVNRLEPGKCQSVVCCGIMKTTMRISKGVLQVEEIQQYDLSPLQLAMASDILITLQFTQRQPDCSAPLQVFKDSTALVIQGHCQPGLHFRRFGPLTDGASSGMGDTLEQQRRLRTIYRYPRPGPLSIEVV